MKDEIKEILDYFRTYATVREATMIKKVYKYITNLQEKYEEADNDRHKLFEQKEKAIEYIDNIIKLQEITKGIITPTRYTDIKNILQGDNNNE